MSNRPPQSRFDPARPRERHFQPQTFHDLMAEQLSHAPWITLSAACHALVLLMLYVLVPASTRTETKALTRVDQTQTPTPDSPPPPAPPKVVEEPEEKQVVVDETQVPDTDRDRTAFDSTTSGDTGFDAFGNDVGKESAFDSNQWNAAVGLGGGAGGRYGGRSGGKGGGRGGGGKSYAAAIDAGLQWLKNHQDDDGKWDCDQFMKHDTDGEPCDGPGSAVHDVGVTGLALLAFLGDDSTMRSGPYRETVKKGVLWLRSQQQPNGLFGTDASHDFVYDHAIAAYAMCEAYGLSQYHLLANTAQRGINYLESHRNPYSVWRYLPRDNDNDTSVTGWCVMAYESGDYFKLTVNKQALELAAVWFDSVSDPTGRHGYTRAGERSSRKPGEHATRFPVERGEALTAVGLFCRFFIGQDPKEKPVMTAAANLIAQRPPVWDPKGGSIDFYYWYYGTYALFQMGGRHWTDWQKMLEPAVVKTQHREKEHKNLYGSWDPIDAWGEDGGRVYSTAILVLTLEAYYRYSKLLR
ncbi:MAG TPA: prenyltransferase/squalene oxidase repeat-containing protein [Planctomycetota bacterium]|nr:prenyltransferase/squalene oxidase repeat-containing protein [Planctomycetota bacterium]